MFILPPNCIVPSATSLTISPVFPNFLYFISHTPSAANENCDNKLRIGPNSTEASKRFRVPTGGVPTHLRNEPRGHTDPLRHAFEDGRDAAGMQRVANFISTNQPPKYRP